MFLATFLTRYGWSQRECAVAVHVDDSTISGYLLTRRFPADDVLLAIQKWTDGKVGRLDWLRQKRLYNIQKEKR